MEEERIKNATDAALESFKDTFVYTMDHARQRMMYIYRPNSVLIWNGQQVVGADKIGAFLCRLPPTETEINVMDIQPLVSLFFTFIIIVLFSFFAFSFVVVC